MRRSLTQLVAAASVLAVAYAPASYGEKYDYSNCRTEVRNILKEVRKKEAEQGREYQIGNAVTLTIKRQTLPKEICILKGIDIEAGGEYNVFMNTHEDRSYMEFIRVKSKNL